MKKFLLFALCAVLFAFFAVPAFAASWSVTVTWGRSVGPNLDREEIFYGGTSKCTVLPAAPTTCNFVIPSLSGELWIRSFNTQGAYADTAHVPISPEPAAATGVSVTITAVP